MTMETIIHYFTTPFTLGKAIEILGFTVGLLYLWWEYHANAKVWIASIVMPLISIWIYLSKGLYADFAINIYYLVIAVYGYCVWTGKKAKQTSTPRPITHVTPYITLTCLAATALIWVGIYWVLVTFTNSTVPVADSFTTALSIVALWMMARKYAEQWLAWLVVDAVCVGLYFYKGIPFYGILYTIYCVVAIAGYRKWLRIMKEQ